MKTRNTKQPSQKSATRKGIRIKEGDMNVVSRCHITFKPDGTLTSIDGFAPQEYFNKQNRNTK